MYVIFLLHTKIDIHIKHRLGTFLTLINGTQLKAQVCSLINKLKRKYSLFYRFKCLIDIENNSLLKRKCIIFIQVKVNLELEYNFLEF